MTGSEIRALRSARGLSARKLGEALGVEPATVLAWERDEQFPTKKHTEALLALLERKPAKTGNRAAEERAAMERSAMEALADPAVWQLFRKLLAHEELRIEVERLASKYADPTGD